MKSMKTYGIHNLLEWHGTIHSHGATMKIDFTNGTTTAYGVAPATFMTKDEFTQHFIENSDEFKSGRIKLIRKVQVAGDSEEASKEAQAKPTKSVITYPEVKGTQKAINVLVGYGVDADQVKTKDDARRFAQELNISFPNL